MNNNLHKNRVMPLHILLSLIFIAGIGALVILCITGGSKNEAPKSFADCIVSRFKSSFEFELLFKENYKLIAEGLNGGNYRMTQVYSDGDREIAFSYEALTDMENQFAGEAGTELEHWTIDPSLGKAVLVSYLKNIKTDGYYAVYAESMNMTAKELAKIIDWHVIVRTPWDRNYRPTLSSSGWYEILSWDSEWTGTNEWADCGERLKKGLHDILSGCEWKCTYMDASADYQAESSFTWQKDGLNCTLDVCEGGYVIYYESRTDPDRPSEYSWYYSCNFFKPASLRTGIKVAAEFKELADSLRTGQ